MIRYVLLHAYGVGGTIRSVFTQANAMAAAGHEVEVVSVVRRVDAPRFPLDPRVRLSTLVDQRDGSRAVPAGLVARRRLPRAARAAVRPPRYVPRGEFGMRNYHRGVERTVIDYLRGLRDGIVVTTRPGLNLLSARFATGGAVRVLQEHVNLATHRGDLQTQIARYYGQADAIAVLTHRDRVAYEALLPGTRIVRIPNAVHSLRQQPATCASRIAVAAGRIRPQKGFDLLVPAFGLAVREHPDWRLRIYGTGERQRSIRALVEEHHLYNHVLLMGTSDRLDDELAKASLYVLSSRVEGLPMVMLEAMAHALPVVSFDCPTGPADVLTHGKEGLLVPPGDVDALTGAMSCLMRDERLRAEMGDAALTTVQSYSPEAVGAQWEELFEDLLARRKHPQHEHGLPERPQAPAPAPSSSSPPLGPSSTTRKPQRSSEEDPEQA